MADLGGLVGLKAWFIEMRLAVKFPCSCCDRGVKKRPGQQLPHRVLWSKASLNRDDANMGWGLSPIASVYAKKIHSMASLPS